ncbi:MAG: DUF433 domain-containing protein [Cyclobacteriaceae bacterium]|nr:DUF433 domain-containing protein [Cyclobacteriaceae bacterium]
MSKISHIITIDPDILGGTPVFKNTRVPVQSLFWHIENGISIDEFLSDFPSVSKEQAMEVMELSGRIFNSPDLLHLYESAA